MVTSLKRSSLVAGLVFAAFGAAIPTATALPASAIAASHRTVDSHRHCIRGGEFCSMAAQGHRGTDAKGRTYVCRSKHGRKV